VKDLADDPFLNWQQRYETGMEAMTEIKMSEKRQNRDEDSMFKRLYKYIVGVNSEAEEIDMTKPVTNKRTRLVRNRERHEMCFWSGSPWNFKELPNPIKDNVYLQDREKMQVFVK
jgi:hypothetical protein